MRWPWQRKVTKRSTLPGAWPWWERGLDAVPSDVAVTQSGVLGLSGVWRAVNLIAGTLAGSPLQTLTEKDGIRVPTASFLDNPGGPGPDALTPFNWKETSLAHALLHGDTFYLNLRNAAGALIGLVPIHPLAVGVDWRRDNEGRATYEKEYRVSLIDGSSVVLYSYDLTQVMGFSLDGLRGLSPITVGRLSLGTAIAGDRASHRQMTNGANMAGMVSAEDDIDEAEAKEIKRQLDLKTTGPENAGAWAVINRKLKFSPWQMSNADAQFLESRAFSIEEIARWYGIPPFELMQTEKQTSWGTGIESQQRGLSRTVLAPWSNRYEEALGRLLPRTQTVAFDFTGLERANPTDEIRLTIEQVNAGLITPNEGRRRQNLEPIAGGDTLRVPGGAGGTATPPAPVEAA